MDFFNIIKDIILKPKDFFAKIKKEKGIKNAFLYFLMFAVITSFLSVLYFYRAVSIAKMPQIELIPGSIFLVVMIILYILILLFTLLYTFIMSGIIHLFVLLMKGKKGFYQTFKVLVYGNTPQYLLSIITSPIYIIVFPKFFGLKQMPLEFFVWFIPSVILGLLVFIYIIYLQTIGIKNLHEIPAFRAFAAVFLLPAALVLLLSLTFFFIAMSIA